MTRAVPGATGVEAGPRRGPRGFGNVWPPVAFGIGLLVLWELVVRLAGVPGAPGVAAGAVADA